MANGLDWTVERRPEGFTPAPTGLARPATLAIAATPATALLAQLDPDRAANALGLLDWLLSPRQRQTTRSVVTELCERFVQAGLPLDRYGSSTAMVTADTDAIGRVWYRDRGLEETVYVRPEEQDPAYLISPFSAAAESGQWVELWLAETPDERFGIVPEFKAAGFVHYLCIPMWLTNGANGWVTFATKRASGFSEQDIITLAFLLPALTMRIDARVGWLTLDKLLRTYVGDEPHTAILSGRAKRGQVTTITAAMLVADLRDSTGHVVELGTLAATDLFNDLFDCLVPGIERRRGEVLKYLGDGLLAIFRDGADDEEATQRALEAAEEAFVEIEAANARHPGRRPMEIGIALHYGEVAYGNIGSGARLDFTVIGRDVALASRIAAMNGPLGRPLLLSAAFAELVRRGTEWVGAFPARGFVEPLDVFALVPAVGQGIAP